MFKIDDEVVIVNKRSKNFGKTAVVKNVHGFSEVLIATNGWCGWVAVDKVEPVKKTSVDVKPEKRVPFIAFPDDNKNMTFEQIQDKIENDHDDTIVMFGDTFENMKDKIISSINLNWGYDEWDNIYVVCGEDHYHIGKEVVVKKL